MSELSLSPVLTSAGLAAVAAAHGQGLQAKITHIALGDGGYAVRDASDAPLAAAQALTVMQSEQVRVGVYAGAIPGPQQIVVEARIDAGKPNFWVKEVGFFLEDGTLFAIWSSNTLNLGFRGDLVPWVFRFALAWTQLPENAVTVEFSGDAGYSDLWGRLNDHITSKDPHPSQIEPAFRTDCDPCMLEFAEPGENLPAPFVFSRGGKGIGFNSLGQYTMVESGTQRDWFDPETQEYKGKLTLPAYGSSCANWNATPTDLTGIQGPYGDAKAVLTVVDDTKELGKVHILKQLLHEGTLNGNVFKLDNSLGTKSTYVTVIGNTSSPGSISTISAWCRTDNGGVIDMAGGFGGQTFSNTSYERIHKTVDMPDGVSARLAVVADPGATVWFILNQCEVSPAPSFVPVITQGAAAVTVSDVLTIGPVEADTVFEQDFTASISGISPVNDGVISQDATHGLVVSSPTTGAVIAAMDVPSSWQGKRFRLLFHAVNGYTRTFYFIGTGGVSLGLRQINPGFAGDITIPHGALELHMRADSVPSNTDVYWSDLKLTELIPFEGWDSDADGHTILLDTQNLFEGTNGVITELFRVSDGTLNNYLIVYQAANNGQMSLAYRGNGTTGTSLLIAQTGPTDVLTALAFDMANIRFKKTGATSVGGSPVVMPEGLSQIKFGTSLLKRFAVYTRYLPEADVNAMVQK
ncbi:hypothetical protein TH25_19250 [Thalassospira profundimaris]|uniref:Phage tail fibre protein N-terminal domain-containing protein n=1 Tax=Thalassospira profundimaris TaxID=502049 RepID=A0A367WTT8_9PROT|nr:phage tail protein [Thalassospira profundimaris]RCK44797.1 hypothetical protein TH25_19250 [Thalassospira profundimaris]